MLYVIPFSSIFTPPNSSVPTHVPPKAFSHVIFQFFFFSSLWAHQAGKGYQDIFAEGNA
jgi:hypothetical protein